MYTKFAMHVIASSKHQLLLYVVRSGHILITVIKRTQDHPRLVMRFVRSLLLLPSSFVRKLNYANLRQVATRYHLLSLGHLVKGTNYS